MSNRSLPCFLCSMALLACLAQESGAEIVRYVAPSAQGNGAGTSPSNAAVYTDSSFWSNVQGSLNSDAVTVRWLDGEYNSSGLELTNMGDPTHLLTLTGDTDSGAILNAYTSTMLKFKGVQNTVVRDLNFTDPSQPDPDLTDNIPGYGLQITSNGSTPSRKIVMDSLSFTNMTQVYYGASGTTHETYDVSLRNSTFTNVGYDGHAHMMYNAYDPHHISVYNNTFTDSKGDYVRFRDNTDYGEVIDNTFVSNGSVYTRPFVAMPLFNDDNPNAVPPPTNPNYEWFGTHQFIKDNEFTYNVTSGGASLRSAIAFYHRGYDPPGYNFLMTAAEGATLENGTTQQKYDLLLNNTEIDGDKVRVYGNTYHNEVYQGAFNSAAAYGAVSKGWSGWADVFDTWNTALPNVTTGDKLVDWKFDNTDNNGGGWTNNSAQALQDAGWNILPGAADDAKTFVDASATMNGSTGLMWVRDWVDGETISVDYPFERIASGKAEWRMGIAGQGAEFGLFNGSAYEGGLSMLGVELVESDTLRILGGPAASQEVSFPGVDFGELHSWLWEWSSDPDGVNGTAGLMFQNAEGVWELVYSARDYNYNIVPDTFFLESPGDMAQNEYIVLDEFTITALETLNDIEGDLNQDGTLTELDWFIFVLNNGKTFPGVGFSESYLLGDLDADLDNDTDDFVLFRSLFNAANGEGAFRAMLTGTPEPSSLLLLTLGAGGLCLLNTRRRR